MASMTETTAGPDAMGDGPGFRNVRKELGETSGR
jgi:hypothetical protein